MLGALLLALEELARINLVPNGIGIDGPGARHSVDTNASLDGLEHVLGARAERPDARDLEIVRRGGLSFGTEQHRAELEQIRSEAELVPRIEPLP